MESFRLIQSGFCNAQTNMAIDEALFADYREGVFSPTLRLYGWKPAAFSLGSSQKPENVLNLDACAESGIAWVRRLTGGGTLFHDDELTYSVILSQSDIGLGMNVKESFEKITSFLIETYGSLGLRATFAKEHGQESARNIADLCFSRNEEYDILINGKKIGGNAQKRKKNIILQHGSIPFSFSKDKIRRFLKNPDALNNIDVTSLDEILKAGTDFNTLSETLIRSFSRHFDAYAKT